MPSAAAATVQVPIEILRQILQSAENQIVPGNLRLSDLERLVLLDYAAAGHRSAARVVFSFRVMKRAMGDAPVADLTERVLAYVEQRRAQKLRPATIRYDVVLLRRACRLAVERKLLAAVPWLPKIVVGDNRRTGCPAEEDLSRLLTALPRFVRDPATWASYTSWRRRETLDLEWCDIDRERGVAALTAERSKNGEARLLPYHANPVLVWLINDRWAHRQGPYVFHRNGRRLVCFRGTWKTACERSKVRCTFHDLRRVAISRMVRAGVSQPVAQQISGHKTASMLTRYYIAQQSDLAAAMAKTVGMAVQS
jgi:integrase